MSRVYTQRAIKPDNVIDPDDLNAENIALAGAFNHNIDQHNIPMETLTGAKFKDRTVDGSGGSFGPFANFYSEFISGTNVVTPKITINLRTAAIDGDWNSLFDAGAFGAKKIISSSPAGLLIGDTIIDFERRFGYISPGFTVREGDNFWTDFGVFVNNQLVGQTGPIYPRRYTASLPWFYYSQGGDLVIDIKYRIRTNEVNSNNSHYAQDFNIFTCGHGIMVKLR